MSKPIKVLVVAGARPNFVKVAPLIQCMDLRSQAGLSPAIDYRLVHTGQHYDQMLSAIFFTELGIPEPHYSLGVGSHSQAVQTARLLEAFEPVCLKERPDWLVVVGDVNSTMACALVASKLGIRIAHVEAGLRSFDRSMPEEINRIVTDSIADLLLTPSPDGDENLLREGISPDRIRQVGNLMIDALVANLRQARASTILSRMGLEDKGFAWVTLHRPSNVDNAEALRRIMGALRGVAEQLPVVFAVHPRTAVRIREFDVGADRGGGPLRMIEPLGYHDSLRLTESAAFVLTDSGGLQEESTFFRTPCLTLRPNTERPVTLTLGSNRLTTPGSLLHDVEAALRHKGGLGVVPPLWDGQTAPRVVAAVVEAT
jgi:UDP-N-acetylglucosamine 2-epimerase (non-hydrolysing)